jgi:hypothetical protein
LSGARVSSRLGSAVSSGGAIATSHRTLALSIATSGTATAILLVFLGDRLHIGGNVADEGEDLR